MNYSARKVPVGNMSCGKSIDDKLKYLITTSKYNEINIFMGF